MIQGIHVSTLLECLLARGDDYSLAAARVIREQEIQLVSLEEEIITSELRVYAQAVEIDRMTTHRRAVANSEIKRGRRAA